MTNVQIFSGWAKGTSFISKREAFKKNSYHSIFHAQWAFLLMGQDESFSPKHEWSILFNNCQWINLSLDHSTGGTKRVTKMRKYGLFMWST